jgi:predicted aspartyl protease
MINLKFAEEYRYPSAHEIVSVPIRIRPPGSLPFEQRAVLDTGAAVSRFDKSILSRAGITDITAGEPMKAYTADNTEYQCYVHLIEIEFMGHVMTIPAAFCDDWDKVQNLLGMRGFFEQMLAAFDHARRKFYFAI